MSGNVPNKEFAVLSTCKVESTESESKSESLISESESKSESLISESKSLEENQ